MLIYYTTMHWLSWLLLHLKAALWQETHLLGIKIKDWVSMENSMEAPQEIKKKATIWSSILTSGHGPKGNKIIVLTRLLHPPHSLQHYSQEPRYGNSLGVCAWVHGWRKRSTHTHAHTHNGMLFTSLEKRTKPCHLRQRSWNWEQYTKWNEPEKDTHCIVSLICGI